MIMKKFFVIALCALLLTGCSWEKKKEKKDNEDEGLLVKKTDKITLNKKVASYTGSSITVDVTSESGLPVIVSYYADSNCTIEITSPVDVGTYYGIVRTEGNNEYSSIESSCFEIVNILESGSTVVEEPTPVQVESPQISEPQPEPTPVSSSKMDDEIIIKNLPYSRSAKFIKYVSFSSKSGLPVTTTYYYDSACQNVADIIIPEIVANNAKDVFPNVKPGTYYAIGRTSGNDEYNPASSACTLAVSASKLDDEITIETVYADPGAGAEGRATSKSGLPVTLEYFADMSCTKKIKTPNFWQQSGIWFAIGTTTGNEYYNPATSSCSQALIVSGDIAN